MMALIRKGSRAISVQEWQQFLRGAGMFSGECDGSFGEDTHAATVAFQARYGLETDGIVGPQTWGSAVQLGLPVVKDLTGRDDGPSWPPVPSFRALTLNERTQAFGSFSFTPSPTEASPERITIDPLWVQANIVTAEIGGDHQSLRALCHRKAQAPIEALFQAWREEGLLSLVRSVDGCWSPRFIRGSHSVLSNHAWGTAFDINARYNPLGHEPALKGKIGSVRELVTIANEHGFFWGGHFATRKDGMHFELAKSVRLP